MAQWSAGDQEALGERKNNIQGEAPIVISHLSLNRRQSFSPFSHFEFSHMLGLSFRVIHCYFVGGLFLFLVQLR